MQAAHVRAYGLDSLFCFGDLYCKDTPTWLGKKTMLLLLYLYCKDQSCMARMYVDALDSCFHAQQLEQQHARQHLAWIVLKSNKAAHLN